MEFLVCQAKNRVNSLWVNADPFGDFIVRRAAGTQPQRTRVQHRQLINGIIQGLVPLHIFRVRL